MPLCLRVDRVKEKSPGATGSVVELLSLGVFGKFQ